MTTLKHRLLEYYEKHEVRVDIAFFVGGFLFDVFTLSAIDDPLSIAQQLFYFFITGSILYYDFLKNLGIEKRPPLPEKYWKFRQLALHFVLGSLLSVYSLFFLKSSSFFSSFIFVVILMLLMIANEIKMFQKNADIKISLYVICVFSFFSMMIPTLLGFVGLVPFLLAFILTGLLIYGSYLYLLKQSPQQKLILRGLVAPGASVAVLFLLFYLLGWIPPVPLSVQNMGVYHSIEKSEGQYLLSHENPWWKIWNNGDQDFKAEPGDMIYFFAEVFSPARFDDSVVLHWFYKDPNAGWQSTDSVKMRVAGGREKGYRGFAVKKNYTAGDWRVSVETTDGREIGRLYFEVTVVAEKNDQRSFDQITQ